MSQPEMKFINCAVNDDDQIKKALSDGYRLLHAIPYVDFYITYKNVYRPDGTYESKQIKENEQNKIKYILERDNISRLING